MSICPSIDGAVLPTRQNGKTLPCANLAAENAKLRELVRDLRDHIESDDGFGIDTGWMLDRMRELGVGFDG